MSPQEFLAVKRLVSQQCRQQSYALFAIGLVIDAVVFAFSVGFVLTFLAMQQ